MLRLAQSRHILALATIMVLGFTFTLFSMLYETNLNVEQLVSQRISFVILTKDGQRNTQILKSHFPQARVSLGNNASIEGSLEDIYKEKYIQELEHFMKHSKTMLVMLLEDDVIPVYTNKTLWYHIAINTVPLFSNDLANFDCSKRGLFLTTTSDGNKSLCRMFSKETLAEQIKCLRSITDPIDITIHYCQEQLNITQKRFLAFVHSGMPSVIQHHDTIIY
ncbi:hypothetical protein MAM1_0215d08147 [Mucor ambiguus]|uniref:Uncharacterized protein n=1 Tax=Mucor ambiguus TaxID=91626 RepID=A0A0C9MYA3_9FUNG|nr:hypothetical protein MAM1_0215d08147 [Mucor ambiguus]